jgi:hypothetical protein
MDYAAESKNPEIVKNLMQFFLGKGLNDCFAAMLWYDGKYAERILFLRIKWSGRVLLRKLWLSK